MTTKMIVTGTILAMLIGCSGGTASVDDAGGTKVIGDPGACTGKPIPEIGCVSGQPVAKCEGGSWKVTCESSGGECTLAECGPAPAIASEICYDGSSSGPTCGRNGKGECGNWITPCASPDGKYGGEHLELELSSKKTSSVHFDCGEGSFGYVSFQLGGAFTVEGTYTAGSGVQPVDAPTPQKATYSGKFTSKTHLQLRMAVAGAPDSMVYELELGQEAKLTRCL